MWFDIQNVCNVELCNFEKCSIVSSVYYIFEEVIYEHIVVSFKMSQYKLTILPFPFDLSGKLMQTS